MGSKERRKQKLSQNHHIYNGVYIILVEHQEIRLRYFIFIFYQAIGPFMEPLFTLLLGLVSIPYKKNLVAL